MGIHAISSSAQRMTACWSNIEPKAEDVRSRDADEASFDEHVKAMTGGGQHPVINRPVLIPDFLDGEALDLGANRRTSAKGREAGLQGSARERTGVRPFATIAIPSVSTLSAPSR